MSFFRSTDREQIEALRRQLPRAWPALFRRFGRLTEVQVRALPLLCEGRNAVICSATASGKTEAAYAALVESMRAGAGLQLAHLVPTRALANDLERRMSGPLRSIGLRIAVRTGDRPELSRRDPAEVVLTTPESLDSMLCRMPEQLETISAVIVDELHVVDGNYRGDQLRVLLRRLARLIGREPHTVALSATLADAEAVGRRYFSEPVAVESPGRRDLRLEIVSGLGEAVTLMKEERRRKALAFANRRRDVEDAARELAAHWPRDRIAVHHAGLTRSARENAERAMRSWPFGICVATTTLEIGLDIGEVDTAILLGVPPQPSAFQQRLGRACRRDSEIFAIACATGQTEIDTLRYYERLAREGRVEAPTYVQDLSVVAQQIQSLLYAHRGGLSLEVLAELLEPLCDAAGLAQVIDALNEEGRILQEGERLLATATTIDLGERGKIHSNIPDTREWAVVDDSTGKAVGTTIVGGMPGQEFFLAGHTYRVVRAARGRLTAKRSGSGPGRNER